MPICTDCSENFTEFYSTKSKKLCKKCHISKAIEARKARGELKVSEARETCETFKVDNKPSTLNEEFHLSKDLMTKQDEILQQNVNEISLLKDLMTKQDEILKQNIDKIVLLEKQTEEIWIKINIGNYMKN